MNYARLISRRDAIRRLTATGLAIPLSLLGCSDRSPRETEAREGPPPADFLPPSEDELLFHSWVETLVVEGFASPDRPLGEATVRVGELAAGTAYESGTLDAYILAGEDPARIEPLTLSLRRFDCVTLVETCLAAARVARRSETPTWEAFAAEMEKIRYRGGRRGDYATRLHYFSEWLHDNEGRGHLRNLGEELGGVEDSRSLRFLSSHVDAYPALAYPEVRAQIQDVERKLDSRPRWVVPTERIPAIADRLQSGDVLAFATAIEGLDVTHPAFAYRDAEGALRVLHAPLSGGVVEITTATLPEYVAAIRQSTGILVGRPLDG